MNYQPLTDQLIEEARQIGREFVCAYLTLDLWLRKNWLRLLCFVSDLRHVTLLLFAVALLLTACSLKDPSGLSYFAITRTPTTTPTATATATPELCTVQTGLPSGSVNLRTGAGTQYPIVRVLDEGEVLTVIARGDWLEVMDTRGNKGYVYSRYCK